MKKIINNLREKPVHVRRMIALVTSVSFTVIIGLVWVSNLVAVGASPKEQNLDVEKTPSPIALMYDGVKDFMKSTGNQLADVSSSFSFLKSTNTADVNSAKYIATTSNDGVIGVGILSNDSNSDTLIKEQ